MDKQKSLALPSPWGENVCTVTLIHEKGWDGLTLTYHFESFKLCDCEIEEACFLDSDLHTGGKQLREALGDLGYAFLSGVLSHPRVTAVRLSTGSFTLLRQQSQGWKEIRRFTKFVFCSIYGFDSLYYEQHS